MQKKTRSIRRLFPKRGYLLLMVGVLIGFTVSFATSLFYSGSSQQSTAGIPEKIEFEFLYTSEKQGWIEEVTPQFEKWFQEKFNIEVSVRRTVTGTHDTVNQILSGSKPSVWSPASSIWIPYINKKWSDLGYSSDVASDYTSLVLSPVVLVGWGSFLEQHNVTGFLDLYQLANEFEDIIFGHPDPLLSNGGTMTVILEFAEAAGKKPEELIIEDLKNETVLDIVKTIESKAIYYGKSTGFYGAWAAENGPSAIDFFGIYENVVIDNSLRALSKWNDPLVAIYPQSGTLIADHPFVILNGEWISSWQRFAAGQYLFFLLKPEIQELAQDHGFRPASSSVPLRQDIFNSLNGVQYEINVPIYKPLKGEVMEAIFTAWVKVKNTGL